MNKLKTTGLYRYLLVWMLALVPVAVWALGETAGDLPTSELAQPISVDSQLQNRMMDRKPGNYGQPVSGKDLAAFYSVFGEQIFSGGFSGVRADGLNPEYKVSAGDQIILRIWGAVNIDRVLPVDAQGNIFIPSIGPVHVSGVNHSQLDSTVRAAVKSIYPENVQVYTQLQGVQPVAVFVTGFVSKPGRYAGTPNDSLLYFLNQAQGIDKESGSYRIVKVMRNGKTIAEADLYAFLTEGYLPQLQFKDGDTIFVGRRGPTVGVIDSAGLTKLFELTGLFEIGEKLLQYSPIDSSVSHVLVKGNRQTHPFSDYLSINDFRTYQLHKDDRVSFVVDEKPETIVVQVEGSYLGQSHFVLPKNARLIELLDNIPVDAELTDTDSISIRRLSVEQQQKESLDASLRRLENTYLTATSSTAEEASIRIKEAELISDFVKRAAQVKPNGRLVVATNQGVADIRLQDGDVVTIPSKAESVLISGQVLVPRSVVFQSNMTLEEYIQRSGGYTDQADPEKIVVIRQSGEVLADASAVIKPGDEILVLPKVPTKNIQLATSISQILYQIAIAAKVAFDL